jgi:hypothetical protein
MSPRTSKRARAGYLIMSLLAALVMVFLYALLVTRGGIVTGRYPW